MDKYKKIGLVTFGMLLGVVGSLYAAGNIITNLTQEVKDGDIISSAYYNNLNGTKADGKACKYSGGKLVCIDDLNSGGSSTTTDITGKDNIFSTNCEYKVLLDNAYYVANRVGNATFDNNGGATNRLIWSAGGGIECGVPGGGLHGGNQQIWCKNVNSSIWEINKTPSESQSLGFKVYETCNGGGGGGGGGSIPGQGVTTPMHKTNFGSPINPRTNEAEYKINRDAYNNLVDMVDAKWLEQVNGNTENPGYKEQGKLGGNPHGWYNTCIVKEGKFYLDNYNLDNRQWCSEIICKHLAGDGTSNFVQCGDGSRACPRSVWSITCMH